MGRGQIVCVYDGRHFGEERKHGFFLLAVDGKVIVGNTPAMYVNHSCNPNCEMVPWHYGEEPVGVLITRRPVPKGEGLTFNYRATGLTANELFECQCGSKMCRRIIGPGFPIQDEKYLIVNGGYLIVNEYGRKVQDKIQLHDITGVSEAGDSLRIWSKGRDPLNAQFRNPKDLPTLRDMLGAPLIHVPEKTSETETPEDLEDEISDDETLVNEMSDGETPEDELPGDMLDEDDHVKEKCHKCTTCGRSYTLSYNLRRHERMHTGGKHYKCSHLSCNQTFLRLDKFKDHQRVHTREKPYRCDNPACGWSFTQLGSLKIHQKRRMCGLKQPYQCGKCGKCFTRSDSLKRHRREQHKD